MLLFIHQVNCNKKAVCIVVSFVTKKDFSFHSKNSISNNWMSLSWNNRFVYSAAHRLCEAAVLHTIWVCSTTQGKRDSFENKCQVSRVKCQVKDFIINGGPQVREDSFETDKIY